MNEELVNIDTVLDFLKHKVETREALNTEIWLDIANKMNILLIDEEAKLIELEGKYNEKVMSAYESMDKKNMTAAVRMAKLSPEYTAYQLQESKLKRAEECIRINKKRSDRAAGF